MTTKKAYIRKLEKIRVICESSINDKRSPWEILGQIEAISTLSDSDNDVYGT